MKKTLLFLSLIASISTVNAQWVAQATGFSEESRGLLEIKIVNENVVWALAYDGGTPTPPATENPDIQEMTMTSDGGLTWTARVINIENPALHLTNISPVSATTAWIGAVDNTLGLGGVYKTIDGGESWNQQNVPAYLVDGESWFNGVHFFDENVGLTIGDPTGTGANRRFEIYRTTDGGDTWATLTTTVPVALADEYGYGGGFEASGDTFWFTTSKGRIFRTNDRGVTWSQFQSPTADFGGYTTPGTSATLHFSTPSIGCLLRTVRTGPASNYVYTRTFFTTTNGGQTFTGGAAFSGNRYILNYIPGTTYIVATSQQVTPAAYGTSISLNNGTSFDEVESDLQRGAAAFLSPSIGWCAGFSEDIINGGIYKLETALSNNAVAATKFKVYPNPASSIVTISNPAVETANLSVTDLTGKVVMTKALNGIENTVDVSALSSGAYFFEIKANDKKEVIKILKN